MKTVNRGAPPPNVSLWAAFAPGDPLATQSCQAACISTTNAWPSGDCAPLDDQSSGLTTGVSQPLASNCIKYKKRVWLLESHRNEVEEH